MKDVQTVMQMGPVIPVLAFASVDEGVSVCKALYDGGVKVFEITLRTDAGLGVIERMAGWAADAAVGVGTLVTSAQCRAARDAGATFGVSPGLTAALDAAARDAGLPLLPGVMTPTDIVAALALGYRAVKFFPAVPAGGIPMLKAFHGPFPDLSFCPTGGIDVASAPDFLALPNVACVGGSWLTPKAAVAARDWRQITRLAQAAAALPRG
ncbi:bifunctional 4-hydroxy-2-oxoglutarate aldolase/2-dehydro-3-deoxy-phosphogluconate aldolase [Chitinasiproducens palmae]|uniref:2-dehydro-3-deoxy-phosphogluconate aldolase n=1 Tax=Chitinasiproducens palmae TaxID=1770053 RepID=A0A1H2PRG8_9BURK|nr:bifunctional 4-hydroxy-2-oxoglutarate aldolase/2-dehydro-3-deoxy-phosphogluconate aldolase [Chitinasiproducens palmae]SDV49514.1 2-keto-3-deoxy-phosphogluconate aldolase [Chitinasiproducens palmae]